MHPLGLAFAFLAFGLVAGLGLFIAACAAPGLWRSLVGSRLRLAPVMFMHSGLFLFGITLVLAGGYATYKVIYG